MVVPTMLTSPENIAVLIEALEVRFLANRGENLYFGLLTDFRDASAETLPEDEPLVNLARQGVEALNEKYRSSQGDIFFSSSPVPLESPRADLDGLRAQAWEARGPERLFAWLQGFLLGRRRRHRSFIGREVRDHPGHRYAIASRLGLATGGAMAHPLNRAWSIPANSAVCEGYGILQPRVAVSLPGTNRSRYAQLWGSDPGIDPYTQAVSDVYQDLVQEGSFIGKGIYEVDAFERALHEALPRKPDSQPRSSGRVLRPGRAVE